MRFPYDTSYLDGLRLVRYRQDWILWGLLLALLIAAPAFLPKFFIGEVTYLFILCLASLGLMVLTGYTGQVSLGHAAFIAIGAYSHAWLLTQGVPWVLGVVGATALSVLLGLLVGLPAIPVSGL